MTASRIRSELRGVALAVLACLVLTAAPPWVPSAAAAELTKPGTPVGLVLTYLGGAIKAEWAPSPEGGAPTGYNLWLNGGRQVPTTATTYTYDGVAPGLNTVSVLAINDAGVSAEASGTILVPEGP